MRKRKWVRMKRRRMRKERIEDKKKAIWRDCLPKKGEEEKTGDGERESLPKFSHR